MLDPRQPASRGRRPRQRGLLVSSCRKTARGRSVLRGARHHPRHARRIGFDCRKDGSERGGLLSVPSPDEVADGALADLSVDSERPSVGAVCRSLGYQEENVVRDGIVHGTHWPIPAASRLQAREPIGTLRGFFKDAFRHRVSHRSHHPRRLAILADSYTLFLPPRTLSDTILVLVDETVNRSIRQNLPDETIGVSLMRNACVCGALALDSACVFC